MDRITPRNKEQAQWLADTASALAQAEHLTARLMELRGTGDLSSVMAIKAEIAVLRKRVEAMESEGEGDRRDIHPIWTEKSAWGAPGKSA